MQIIEITIKKRVATVPAGIVLVCNNPTDIVRFNFDEEWAEHDTKTARFAFGGTLIDVPFSGNEVQIPNIYHANYVNIGVYTDNLTSTYAKVDCRFSVKCLDGKNPAPDKDVYNQIIALVNGRTPVRGVDYWTTEDQAAITEEVSNQLSLEIADELAKRGQLKPEFANSIEECTDTSLLYVLPDGYIYAYMFTDRPIPNFTNLANQSSADWESGYRINSSGATVAASEMEISNYIPVDTTVGKVHIKGLDVLSALSNGANYGRIYCYKEDKSYIDYRQPSELPKIFYLADYDNDVCICDLDVARVSSSVAPIYNAAYLRFGGIQTSDDVAIACDEEITYNENDYSWQNTGHAFVPADYEGRIVSLEEDAKDHGERLTTLEVKAGSKPSLPTYWTEAVDEAVSKIKALQDVSGKDVVSFVWFSDLHYSPGDPYTKNIGILCAELMDRCDIPYTLMTGDTMSAAVVDSEVTLLSYLDGAATLLSPIGDKILQLRGNHDDVWGTYSADGGAMHSYVNKVGHAKIWNRISRRQTLDTRRVFGGDGSYFYVDLPIQKFRFICLNSHFYNGDGCEDGTVQNMTTGCGQAQLDWLQNEALAVNDGWCVVIATHTPINNSYYLAQYSDGEELCKVIDSSAANILAIFSGHCHTDAVYTNNSRCPNITITCAVNNPYDSTELTRVAGTVTETAIDVVCINCKTGTIDTVRVGVGSDREVGY